MSHSKTFSDPIHGTFALHPLCCKFVDTPQFQRLRDIKQLGGTSFVYQTASHSRFEHSLGVAWLASEWASTLQKAQPHLEITSEQVLCLQLAGLCHDLGHGPFSHMFDEHFVKPLMKQGKLSYTGGDKWEHEAASSDMIDHIMSEYDLEKDFLQYNLRVPEDVELIKSLITGHRPDHSEHKHFFYQIVANKSNNIDVDKFDYFVRDTHALGLRFPFDYKRLMSLARVAEVQVRTSSGDETQWHIVYPEKEAYSIYELFSTRYSLHKKAYQHRVGNVVEIMHCDALRLANDLLHIPGKDGTKCSIAESINDMAAYQHVTDGVFHTISSSFSEKLSAARHVLQRVKTRNFYAFLGETLVQPEKQWSKGDEQAIRAELVKEVNSHLSGDDAPVEIDDIIVSENCINYGCKDKNPVAAVYFYSKKGLEQDELLKGYQIGPEQIGVCLPSCFQEHWLRVYCRSDNPTIQDLIGNAWSGYCGDKTNKVAELTPSKTRPTPRRVAPDQVQRADVKRPRLGNI